MPIPKEIKKIAHEYSVLMAKDIPESNCLKNEVISSTEDYIVQFMSWICTNFCIVPKSKVKERYKESKLQSKAELKFDILIGNSRVSLIESLFNVDDL
ncbi:MAG: hypothetical protein K2M41_02275 [Muribaculaceae bacterium]|nr:hypothetical protein [Muribaculaceae bacterium]